MKKLLLLFALLSAPVFAQVHSDIATQNTQGNWVKAIPGALVYLCNVATSDADCLVGTGAVQLYTDQTLSVTTTQPVTADSDGNYTLFATPAVYKQCVKGVTSFCQKIAVPSVNTTIVPSITCPGALPGSLAAWTSPTDLSCDNQSLTDFLGNLQSQSYQAVGPHNGEVWLTTDGVVSTSALPAGTVGLVVPNVVPTPYRINFPPAPCTDGDVYQQLSHSTDGTGTYNAFLNCLTVGAGTGTVTSFSAGTLAPLFTTSVATSTTTPALSFILTNAAANTIFGNFTGSSGAPSYNAMSACGDSTHALKYTAGTGFGCQLISAGTTIELQTNGVDNTSQVLLNHTNGTASYGFQVTPVNPSGGIDRFDIVTPFTQASDPTAPTLTPTNPGSTHYTYGVAGCEDPGCTRHSALVTTATVTGNATINGSNPIKLTAYADTLYGYRFYVICRTASSGSPASVGVIGSGAWKQFSDNGITADGSTCASTYASNNTKLDDHCLGGNPSIANAMLSVPCGIDTPPASPKALDDEFTAGGAGSPGDSNNPFWVWRNQGTSIDALTNGELIFIPQPGSGADSFRLLTQTSPSTPWTFVAAALPLFTQGSNNQLLGMCVGDGTKFESWTEKAVSNGELEVDRWTNTTTFSANQYGLTIIGAAYPWTWLKLQNDGTNLNFSHSFDGINYFQDYTELKGAFLGTITEIGVCGESTSTSATPQLSVDYFRRTQ